jgi:NAD(P)-dependent dehydrogenase (short-subunit alcohol dehydrogenase family)
MKDRTVEQPVWFITGASSGFGLAITREALSRGHMVAATARKPESLAVLRSEFGDRVAAFKLDVMNPIDCREAVRQAMAAFGAIDVVVNNAGFGLIGALEECDDAQIVRNLQTNLLGPIRVIRAAIPHLRQRGRGHIINISAAAAISNYAGFGVYGAAKAGLECLSESLALELAPFGIAVTCVQPGPFRTDFIARSLDRATDKVAGYERTSGKFAQFLDGASGKQPGDPAKAAKVICDLALQPNAPMRIALGKYACSKVRKKIATLSKEIDQWEAIGSPTDF